MFGKRATIVLTLSLFILAAAISQAAPKMDITPSSFNFGYAPQNAKVTHIFWLKSIGDDSLRITKVIPGCGCTKAPLDKDVLAPGDSAKLEIIFSTKSYRNRVSKAPMIESNEGPDQRKVNIVTHVVSRPDSTYPVVISPYKLDLSQFTDKVRDEIEFDIKNVSDQNLNLTLIDAPGELLSVELPASIKAGETGKGKVVLNQTGIGESFEKSLTFALDNDENSRFTIPIKRTMRVANAK